MVDLLSLNEVLLESAKEIFETMVFMDLSESTDEGQDVEGCALLGTITFKGALEGCLAFCCSTPCAQAIAINMLGLDTTEEIAEEDTCDAIGEIANMVMGSVKKRLAESAGNLEVSIPSVVSGHKLRNNLGEGARKASVRINIEDEYVTELSLLYHENSN
ncbi:MAG: chemotaxis protein CheX [Planctomycetes bacterium]|nr:chemotaxis protein CheX [Planctomycetota bacterium]